jgi:hypothetical protein
MPHGVAVVACGIGLLLEGERAAGVVDYRVYRLNSADRIVAGDWIDAADDADAVRQAQAMCDAATPFVEVWQRHRKVARVSCEGIVDEGGGS